MRILMLSQFYPPIIGGEEQHVRNLSIALVKRGHDVVVVTLCHAELAEFEIDEGVRVYRIGSTAQRGGAALYETDRRHAPPIPDPEILLGLRHVIRRERPDIVHAHNWILHSFVPLKAWSKAKFVVTLHDYSLRCAKKTLIYHDAICAGPGLTKCLECAKDHFGPKGIPITLSNWVMSGAERGVVDMFISVSEAVAVGNGLTKTNLPSCIIPNFVLDDVGTLPPTDDPRLAQLPNEDFLLFIGDLRPLKGITVLLEAYRKLVNAPPLVLIGRELSDTPKALPPNVIMLKSWPHDAVMHAWRRSMLGLAPSVWLEPFGIVVIEAMASGRAVIGSNIGGIPDIIVDGETGFLFPAGNAIALQQKMEQLIADPGLRNRMGEAGKQRSTQFHESTVVPRIEHVYLDLLEKQA